MPSVLFGAAQTNHGANIKGASYIYIFLAGVRELPAPRRLPAAFVNPLLYLFCCLGIHYAFTFLRQENLLNISDAGSCLT